MKNQALFSSTEKSKKSKCRLLQFLFGALKVNFMYTLRLKNISRITHSKLKKNQMPLT